MSQSLNSSPPCSSLHTANQGSAGRSQVAPLGAHTAQGAFWTILFSLLNKAVAFGSQIALAWFLLPKDMGLVGMALSVTSMAALISGMNLKNVLIQRQEHFDRDVGQVFWLSLVMGLTSSLLLALAAPLAGLAYHDSRVVPLILLVSISNFLGSAPAVYAAVLSRDLHFRSIAVMNLVSGLINNLGAIGLAALGFGPYSLILPLIGSAAFALVMHRWIAGRVTIPRPEPSQWVSLLRPAGLLMLNSLLTALLGYGANFVIGVQHNATIAGYYFWGFSIACQAVYLLAGNLHGVVFPALARLNGEPRRQSAAFRRSCVLLLAATLPLCVLQILLARPAIQLVFHDRWLPAAGVVQGLSLGLMTQPISIIASSLLMARGAYGALCWISGISAILTFIAAVIGGELGNHNAVAWAVGMAMLLSNVFAGWQALKVLGAASYHLLEIAGAPLALAVVVLVIGALAQRAIGELKPIWQCVAIAPLVVVIYVFMVSAFQREVRDMVKNIFRGAQIMEKWLT